MQFEIKAKDKGSGARTGAIATSRGEIETPIFMPVGTLGTVKAVHQRELTEDIDARIILGNTYHLFLRPGLEIIEQAGGLHRFMNWSRPILTDSGGYQVYSLAENRKISEKGVEFQSHIDGSRHFFSPENVVDTQRIIGSDFMMVFDECPPYPCEYDYARSSMEMTRRWARRCCEHFDKAEPLYGHEQTLLPIVQGSVYPDLRKESAEFTAALDRFANAIGGLSVGEPPETMYEMTELVCGILPEDKPRYLMGVGTPANLLECIALGVDMFDCVMPTRNARNGMLFTSQGIINIRNKKWEKDFSPIDEFIGGYVSSHYSKAYLRHLTMSNEMLAAQIASVHNLTFYLWLVKKAREQIFDGAYIDWKNRMIKKVAGRL